MTGSSHVHHVQMAVPTPPMTRLFAAPDATGELRFVGEVDRGADCGCVCPVCGGALVARQGTAYEWHFAHEASQERPECETAAIGVLQGLMLEHLQAQRLALPPWRQRVAIVGALVNLHEDVQWEVRLMGEPQWQAQAAFHEPVATARLDTGVNLFLYVSVEDTPVLLPPYPDGAQLVFRCRVPPASALRERRTILAHLAQHGELVWQHHPDSLGLVAAAQARLDARSGPMYRNWLALSDAMSGSAGAPAAQPAPPAPLFYGPGAPAAPASAPRYACAPEHAPDVSFTFYRLSDTEAWLLYRLDRKGPSDWRTAAEKFYALAPHPAAFDGWAQALPESVGVVDLSLGVVRCKSFLSAVTYLSRRTVLTRSDRDPAAFEGL